MAALPRPKRRFGQNFLTDPGYASKIVELALIKPSDTVVEIGPGRGAITGLVAEKGCRLCALEIDRDLCSHLTEEFAGAANVDILNSDALSFDFSSLIGKKDLKLKVVANLPYNVATPVLFRLLDYREMIDRMVLMFQKEVADRITASPGNKNYGALSIFPQLYCDINLAFKLPPGAFYPPPKVHSAVVEFDVLAKPRFKVEDEAFLKRVVSAAFSQRRKKISNSLKSLFADNNQLNEALAKAGIDPDRRAETVSVEEFCRLSGVASEKIVM